jgi:hypothetical protein
MGAGLGDALTEAGCCGSRKPTLADMTVNHVMAAKKRAEGSCGWCLEFSQHTYYDQGQNLLGRVGWNCDNCKGRTSPAEGTNFARQTPKGGKQNIHPGKEGSSKIIALKRRFFNEEITELTVRRALTQKSDSYYSAVRAGMVRPFLLLSSMVCASRVQIAILLGWPLMEEQHFGTAHAEAWDIIGHKELGLYTRVKQLSRPIYLRNPMQRIGGDWYQLLHKLSDELFAYTESVPLSKSESSTICEQANHPALDIIECQFVDKLAVYLRHKFTSEQHEAVAKLWKSEVVTDALNIMQHMGISRDGIGQLVIDLCFMSLAKRDGSEYTAAVEPSELVEELEIVLGTMMSDKPRIFQSQIDKYNPKYERLLEAPDNSVLQANFEIVWLAMELLGISIHSRFGRLVPIVLHILIHKARLALHGITLDQFVATITGGDKKRPEKLDDLRQRLPPGLAG